MTVQQPQPRVIVFSTPTCSFCNMAKKYFREKGVKFRDVDVSRDQAAARDMLRRSGQSGVPVIDIGGKLIVGFDRPKIDKLLGIH
ncbi:MAG: glutaredoxin domain-containing protein [Chloroflexota bacterium]